MTDKERTEMCKADKGPTFGARHVQILFIFFLGLIVYATRFSFSVTIVAMTHQHSPNPDVPVYDWTNKGILLSTFFWGYIIPQIPIGILGTKFGTKYFILGAMLMNSISSMFIPTMASKFGIEGVAICRVVQGLSQGLIVPCTHGKLGKWAPTNERTRLYGFLSTGYVLGLVAGLSISGFVSESWAGWPLNFYLLPSWGLVWVVLYFFFGAPSPAAHKTITRAEREYIENSLDSQNISNVAIPFKAIFTSLPFLSTVTMSLCSGWGFNIFTTELPIYMDKVMGFNISSTGMVSSLPHVCTLVMGMSAACIADFLITKKYLSIGATRKMMSSIGSLGAAGLFVITAYLPSTHTVLTVLILMLVATFRSLNLAGFNINHLDLAPNFGSTLMGMTNTASELFSLITPIAVQYIVYDEADQSLWRIVFLTAVCMYIFSTTIFVTFASGERQWWNYVSKVPQDEEQHFPVDAKELEHLTQCSQ